MDGILTVADLIKELEEMPRDAFVMVPVVKYPGEFALRSTPADGWRWDLGSDVEVVPLEADDITLVDGQVWLTVELAEFNADRAALNGADSPD